MSFAERDPRQRDRLYLAWVARLPCVACMVHGRITWGVQVAHVRAASPEHGKRYTGKGEKPSDMWTLPLCQPHHTGDIRRVDLTQHDMDELEFWEAHGISDPFQLCLDLRSAYLGPVTPPGYGIAIITKAAAAGRRILEGSPMTDEEKARAIYAAGQADGTIPTKALSIQQPWAWLIVNGYKDIENRDWLKRYPSRILVHTGQKFDLDADRALRAGRHPVGRGIVLDPAIQAAYCAAHVPTGGLVGMVDIIGVQEEHDSQWFVGEYGYILANAKTLPFLPWKGVLGFFGAEVRP